MSASQIMAICKNHSNCQCVSFNRSEKKCGVPKEQEACYIMLTSNNKSSVNSIQIQKTIDDHSNQDQEWSGICSLKFVDYDKSTDILTLQDDSGNIFKYSYDYSVSYD